MNIRAIALSTAVLALAACAGTADSNSKGHHHGHDHNHPHSHSHQATGNAFTAGNAAAQTFECQNGITVRVVAGRDGSGENAVQLNADTIGSQTMLSQAAAASGELYTSAKGFYDRATEWHQKGGEAAFSFTDPYGNTTETVCRRK